MPNPFMQAGGAYNPLMSNDPFQAMTGLEGLPDFGMGPLGQVLGQAAGGMLSNIFGYTPMGFRSSTNMHDRLQNFRFQTMQREAMKAASRSDEETLFRHWKGLAAASGVAWGQQQQDAARKLSSQIAGALPTLTEFAPHLIDQLGGSRGSATVMARFMSEGSRYRFDPVTGRLGMSTESLNQIMPALHEGLFSDANIGAMRGLRAGQAGELFNSLVTRGMIAGGGDPLRNLRSALQQSPADLVQGALKSAGLSPNTNLSTVDEDTLTKLRNTDQGAMALRSFDSSRTKDSLKRMAGAVKAVQEIFGREGDPNAPMTEILNGLDAMTHGAATQLDPSRLESMVRRTYNLAQQTGLGVKGALLVQQHAAVTAQSLGIDPILAVGAAQEAMAFGGGLAASGFNAKPVWGRMNIDQMLQADATLNAKAAGSQLANQLGAVARISSRLGGFQKGSEAAKLMAAIESGNLSGVNLEGLTDQRLGQIIAAGTGGAIGANQAMAFIQGKHANQEFIQRHNIGGAVRPQQGRLDVMPFVRETAMTDIAGTLKERFRLESTPALDIAGRAADAIVKAYEGMSNADLADDKKRNFELMRALGNDQGIRQLTSGMSNEDRDKFLAGLAEQVYSGLTTGIQNTPHMRELKNAQTALTLMSKESQQARAAQSGQADVESLSQSLLAGFGEGSPLQRFADAIMNTDVNDPKALETAIMNAAGALSPLQLRGAMKQQLMGLGKQRDRIIEQQKKIDEMEDGPGKEEARKQLQEQEQILQQQMQIIEKDMEERGLFDPALTDEEEAKARRDGVKGGAEPDAADQASAPVEVNFPDTMKIEGELTITDDNKGKITATNRSRGGGPVTV